MSFEQTERAVGRLCNDRENHQIGRRLPLVILAAATATLSLLPSAATAANKTWTGSAGSTDWATGVNWGNPAGEQ